MSTARDRLLESVLLQRSWSSRRRDFTTPARGRRPPCLRRDAVATHSCRSRQTECPGRRLALSLKISFDLFWVQVIVSQCSVNLRHTERRMLLSNLLDRQSELPPTGDTVNRDAMVAQARRAAQDTWRSDDERIQIRRSIPVCHGSTLLRPREIERDSGWRKMGRLIMRRAGFGLEVHEGMAGLAFPATEAGEQSADAVAVRGGEGVLGAPDLPQHEVRLHLWFGGWARFRHNATA